MIAEASRKIADESRKVAMWTRRDSTDMRIITAITLIFLPGTFTAVRSPCAGTAIGTKNTSTDPPWLQPLRLPGSRLKEHSNVVFLDILDYHWNSDGTGSFCLVHCVSLAEHQDGQADGPGKPDSRHATTVAAAISRWPVHHHRILDHTRSLRSMG